MVDHPTPANGDARPVGLSKVTLTKSAPTVSLSKHGTQSAGQLRVNLNWNPRPSSAQASTGGFFKRLLATALDKPIDLDLGCLYEFADGTKGVVQALGNAFASRNPGSAIISLDGDDRSGANTEGENLRIDLTRLEQIRRILVFAFIYEGTPNWADADAVVTLFPHASSPIEVRLDDPDPQARTCAIAMLDNTGTDLSIHREVHYINGGQDALDHAYGWGLHWAPGHK
jgi:tellurite resistance protein TerA